MTKLSQLAQRLRAATAAGRSSVSSAPAGGFGHHRGRTGLRPSHRARRGLHPLAGLAQLGDQPGLLELADRAQDLPHHFRGWRRINEVGWRIDRDQLDVARAALLLGGCCVRMQIEWPAVA